AMALYDAFAEGRPSSLAELPVQYADYARWQREAVYGDMLEMQLAYWKEQVFAMPALELPTDRPRPRVPTLRGDSLPFDVAANLGAGLRRLAEREKATLFMALLAPFQAFLFRHSGQDDFAIGSPVAGRPRSELEGLIGFFVNAVVLRADL